MAMIATLVVVDTMALKAIMTKWLSWLFLALRALNTLMNLMAVNG